MILVDNGKGFGFHVKVYRLEPLNGSASTRNPFAEIGLNVVKAETRLSVQVEIPAKRHFSRMIFLFVWFLG